MQGGLDQKSGMIWRAAICTGTSRTSIQSGLALDGWGQPRSGNLGLGVSLRIFILLFSNSNNYVIFVMRWSAPERVASAAPLPPDFYQIINI